MSAQLSRITVAEDTVYPRPSVLPAAGVEALERGKVAFTVMVEARDMLRVRKAVAGMGGAAVEIIKCVPVPRSTRMRLFVRLEAGRLDATIRQIMRAVERGEFGRVVRL